MASGVLEDNYEEELLFASDSTEMKREFEEEEQVEEKDRLQTEIGDDDDGFVDNETNDGIDSTNCEEKNYYCCLMLMTMLKRFQVDQRHVDGRCEGQHPPHLE